MERAHVTVYRWRRSNFWGTRFVLEAPEGQIATMALPAWSRPGELAFAGHDWLLGSKGMWRVEVGVGDRHGNVIATAKMSPAWTRTFEVRFTGGPTFRIEPRSWFSASTLIRDSAGRPVVSEKVTWGGMTSYADVHAPMPLETMVPLLALTKYVAMMRQRASSAAAVSAASAH